MVPGIIPRITTGTKRTLVANKHLGQHWLNDQTILSSMLEEASVQPGDKILEIGPGQGSLTRLLLKQGAVVIAVELDDDLVGKLKITFSDDPNLQLISGDILDFDLREMGDNYKVIANIPYYLTGKLIRKLLETTSPPLCMVLLVQKEVAERLAALQGKMSILGVVSQYYADVSLGQIAKAELFTPPPKVDSQVVILSPRKAPSLKDAELFRIVKIGFSSKRKKLANNLSAGLDVDKKQIVSVLQDSGLHESIRAQELTIKDWLLLQSKLEGRI